MASQPNAGRDRRVSLFSLGAAYVCTRGVDCPVAAIYGEKLIGLPGRDYTCECGAPMQEMAEARGLTRRAEG